VPKALREAAGLASGTPLEIRVVGGHLEIAPAPVPVKLERRGKLLVAVPQRQQPPLTAAAVEAVTEALRAQRGQAKRRGRGSSSHAP
jgi:bifunctional DNA-binding transcriptional regulator/antitoxin component of YhaV-PrlF toxin-antitoxin module